MMMVNFVTYFCYVGLIAILCFKGTEYTVLSSERKRFIVIMGGWLALATVSYLTWNQHIPYWRVIILTVASNIVLFWNGYMGYVFIRQRKSPLGRLHYVEYWLVIVGMVSLIVMFMEHPMFDIGAYNGY